MHLHLFLIVMFFVALGSVPAQHSLAAEKPIIILTERSAVTERTLQGIFYDYTLEISFLQPNSGERTPRFTHNVRNCQHCGVLQAQTDSSGRYVALMGVLTPEMDYRTHVDIYIADLAEGALRQVETSAYTLAPFAFSPNGAQLAYTRFISNEPSAYVFVVLDWQQEQVLLERVVGSSFIGTPQWDPQGEWLLLQRSTLAGQSSSALSATLERLLMVDGSKPPEVLVEGAFRPRWSPDGALIAYCESRVQTLRAGEGYLSLMDRDGQGQRRLTQMPVLCRELAWLPQGDRLLYSDGRNLFTVTVSDGATQRVFSSAAPISNVRVSPDGRYVAFIRNNQLDLLALDGSGKVRRLTDANEYVVGIDW